tara:strand:- start:18 stop:776 length:759 start_codon:yes stop_codon:yes gene_type:complete
MKKIILMANDLPGYEVAKHIINSGDTILRVYLHNNENLKYGDEIIKVSQCDDIFTADDLKNEEHVDSLKKLNADFIVTVFWAHLLKPNVINSVKDTVNFHPALLPINRGWHPHVHSIIDGSPLGVTLHRIDEGIDTGAVWVQKEVHLSEFDTAKTIYHRLQNEIIDLFKNNWIKIKNGEIIPINQDETEAIYHSKFEINEMDVIDLSSNISNESLIRKLRARSFGNLGFAYYVENGKKVYLNIRLSDTHKFE